jgi:FkbM family methyltransferase
MNRWLRALLPFGVVRALQIADQLTRLGLAPRHARRLARQPATWARLQSTNLHLLPDGALAGLSTRAVVDVGTNVGDWIGEVLELCDPGSVHCVEPDPRLIPGLERRLGHHHALKLHACAVGATPGTAEFRLMSSPDLNSMREPEPEVTGLFPAQFRAEATIQVPVHTLDELLPPDVPIALLKIDVQGFEREVLAGAGATLRRTDYVLLEANFRPFYRGEADFFELTALMRGHGFAIANYSSPKGGQREALYADVLFVRRREAEPSTNPTASATPAAPRPTASLD